MFMFRYVIFVILYLCGELPTTVLISTVCLRGTGRLLDCHVYSVRSNNIKTCREEIILETYV
jgi:hypothetical protein